MTYLKKRSFSAIAAACIAAIAVPAAAHPTHMRHGQMMGGPMGMMEGHYGMMGLHGMGMGMARSYAMTTFDADGDGMLSAEEITSGMQAELKAYDADGDGALSLEEFATMHAAHTRPMTVRAFQMHDADGDAKISEAEIAASAAMMQRRMSERPVDMRGMGMGAVDDD